MKILHTSDWHLGATLYKMDRHEEFEKTLDWLLQTIQEEKINTLLVSGDIFDNQIPNHQSIKQYHRFLARLLKSPCRNVVITAGNHDSASLLETTQDILKYLNISIIGNIDPNRPEEEIVTLYDEAGNPEGVVGAVPFLHERFVRKATPGETSDEKVQKYVEGMKSHFLTIAELAKEKRDELQAEFPERSLPILMMGHLFMKGGKTAQEQGVASYHIGGLAQLGTDAFPDYVDYAALGHLHAPQIVGGKENIRYSGSLVPVGFGELGYEKKVVIIETGNEQLTITEKAIPPFVQMEKIEGSEEQILARIEELKKTPSDEKIYLDINFLGDQYTGNLLQTFTDAAEGSHVIVCNVSAPKVYRAAFRADNSDQDLDLKEFTPLDVFKQLLQDKKVSEENGSQRLLEKFGEILAEIENQNAQPTD